MATREFNYDGLIGPTHNYAGLARGNLASQRHRGLLAEPRAAALQGLAKMRRLHELGVPQGVLPPQQRPDLAALRRLGFTGSDAALLARARREAPQLLAACCSASSMWVANAATVSPGADSGDGRVHFTPANLCGHLHRALEVETSARILRAAFPAGRHFAHHAPLPATPALGDEGAANHTRLCAERGVGGDDGDGGGDAGVELFVYGEGSGEAQPHRHPARQTLAASRAVARLHGLDPARTVFAQQHPAAIDAGVFHNDVIAVGHRQLLFCHELAFLDRAGTLESLQRATHGQLQLIEVPASRLSLGDAVDSYLFNSQLVTLGNGELALIAPVECREQPRVWAALEEVLAADNPISQIEVIDLRQSMHNGGGPACLRLRVALDEAQVAAANPALQLDAAKIDALEEWVKRHYRDRLAAEDLADPRLLDEGLRALDELSGLLQLGALYPFQRDGVAAD